MPQDTASLAFRVGLALAIGLLVGLERGWRDRDAAEGSRTAGLRTFGLAGLLGGISAALAQVLGGGLVLGAGFLAFAAVFGAFKYRESVHDAEFSVTTVIAGLAVFALGALAVAGDFRLAAASGAAVAVLLAGRVALHRLLRRITWIELRSAILLGAMTMIGLSLLPHRTIDPWGGFDPWEIWLLTVLTASISFAGYVAVRVLSPASGLLVSGLAGGLVSSTATVAALARAAMDGSFVRQRSGAATLACMVSLLRVCALIAIVQPRVLGAVLPAMLAAAAVLALAGAALIAGPRKAEPEQRPASNPFEIAPLLTFAGFFAVVSMTSAALAARFGGTSVLVTSALSGLVDADVATLSALRLVDMALPVQTAGLAVLAAVGLNALTRVGLALTLGPRAMALPFALATAAAIAAAAVSQSVWQSFL
jgi:uncharacterized membrane protein (DUF4010 family)